MHFARKNSGLVRVFVAVILFSVTLTVPALAQWRSEEIIQQTEWIYAERFESGSLVQCQIVTQAETVNQSSTATIIIAVLSKGSIVVSIEDVDLANRINIDFGWEEEKEFSNVQLGANDVRVPASGKIFPGMTFVVEPKSKKDFLASPFFQSEGFFVTVGGLTFKAFNVPKLPIAWAKLRTCALVALTSHAESHAADPPWAGYWADSDADCRSALGSIDVPGEPGKSPLFISSQRLIGVELFCTVAKVLKSSKDSFSLNLSCASEGTTASMIAKGSVRRDALTIIYSGEMCREYHCYKSHTMRRCNRSQALKAKDQELIADGLYGVER